MEELNCLRKEKEQNIFTVAAPGGKAREAEHSWTLDQDGLGEADG